MLWRTRNRGSYSFECLCLVPRVIKSIQCIWCSQRTLVARARRVFRTTVEAAPSPANQAKYQRLVQTLTQDMTAASKAMRQAIQRLKSFKAGADGVASDGPSPSWCADMIEQLQTHEKNNLRYTVQCQLLRYRIAAATAVAEVSTAEHTAGKASSAADEAGIGALREELQQQQRAHRGALDNINEVLDELRVEAAEHLLAAS